MRHRKDHDQSQQGDLGQISLLEDEGSYSSQTDLMRTDRNVRQMVTSPSKSLGFSGPARAFVPCLVTG